MGHVDLLQADQVVDFEGSVECKGHIVVASLCEVDSLCVPVTITDGLCSFCLVLGVVSHLIPVLTVTGNINLGKIRCAVSTLYVVCQLVTSIGVELRSDEHVVPLSIRRRCSTRNPVVVIAAVVVIVAVDAALNYRACGIDDARLSVVEVGRPGVGTDDGCREGQCVGGRLFSTEVHVLNGEVAGERASGGSVLRQADGDGLIAFKRIALSRNGGHTLGGETVGQRDALDGQGSQTAVVDLEALGRALGDGAPTLSSSDAAGRGASCCAEHKLRLVSVVARLGPFEHGALQVLAQVHLNIGVVVGPLGGLYLGCHVERL